MDATVIVSCYRQEKYINECLDSILSQDVDFPYIILVSDDASPDGTPEILRSYAEQYPDKIKLVLRDKNVGAARNYIDAHNSAQGEIIFHFDGDDVMQPGKLQRQFDIFRNRPDVNLVFHRASYFSDDGSYNVETGTPCFIRGEDIFFDVEDLALWGSITVHSAYAYRRSSRKVRNLDREFMEWFFAMDSMIPDGKAAYIDEPLVRYRCNPSGGAYLSTKAGQIKSYNIYFRDVRYYYDKFPNLRRYLYSNFLFTTFARLKAGCGLPGNNALFLLRHMSKLSLRYLLETYKVRKSVAPPERIR